MIELESPFGARVDAFFEAFFALEPIYATAAGYHAHDGRWPDLTEAGRSDRLAFIERWTAEFRAFDSAGLTLDQQVDRELLVGQLEAQRFAEVELREEAWSPMAWVYLIGEGLFGLVAREFAPAAVRLASVAARAESLPAVVAVARETLIGHAGRPVDRLHTEQALEQWPGLISIVADALSSAEAVVADDADVAAVLPRLRSARATAADALDALERHLREEVLPGTSGEGRLGSELFAAKMAQTVHDPGLTPERIRDRAEGEFSAVRSEMIRIAREIAPRWLPDGPVPEDDGAVVRAVLDAIAMEHPG